ncbi:Capsanthin/capsorubin synthase, chromoplast [Acorus gramineus]|uniref:Capsanthin/capsorubin synthase, chromoplast n=1 Tax=Acorus gramineus TaxID=55184 RepID=A0AAV9AK55_ACOGR|nr:Capsanthin/capsorubin synthase, chromoplast [Acorus gramineus]
MGALPVPASPLLPTIPQLPPHKRPMLAHASTTHSTFLDLKPETKPEPLTANLRWHDPSDRTEYDVAIIGCGPAGLRLAEQVSARWSTARTLCIDPSPLSAWPNNYGAWVDEFASLGGGLESCLDVTWPHASVYFDGRDAPPKRLARPYARVSRGALKSLLLENCASQGVRFHAARAWKVSHDEEGLRSTVSCSDGREVRARLVVDASGFGSSFIGYNAPQRTPRTGYQIAHGVLAEVEAHPFALDEMVLMDWRDAHLGCEPDMRARNDAHPTFLYAMPFDEKLIFLEETSLVSRPAVAYKEVKARMAARLRHMGIRVKRVLEEEKCLIPMGGPLPRLPQSVMGIGGSAGLVHPSTGYMVSRALAMAPIVAEAIGECLGSTRMIRGRRLHERVWGGLWTKERRLAREFYCFGMETLLELDLEGTRRFFEAFFELEEEQWHGFLSSRLTIGELAWLGLSLFGKASSGCKVDMVTKCPLPLVRMAGNLVSEVL